MNKTLSVAAIQNGTVIDHIARGQAFRIVHLLSLQASRDKITIGLHLPSQCLGTKDLIKIENRVLTEDEANEIVVFAPLATINVIENFQVTKKISTRLPKIMQKIFICPNASCITHEEKMKSNFSIYEAGKQIRLICHYCEKHFNRDDVMSV
jgi:aspartate carbamoyltransferase regulatory subunit